MNLHGLRAERELFLGSCDVDADDGFEEYQRRQRAAVPAASNTSSGHNSRVDGAAPSAAPSAAPAKPSLELQAEAEARSRADARRRAQEREGRERLLTGGAAEGELTTLQAWGAGEPRLGDGRCTAPFLRRRGLS